MRYRKQRRNGALGTPPENNRVRRVTATEAAANLWELVGSATHKGETIIIEAGGEEVCEIRPPVDPESKGVSDTSPLPEVDEAYRNLVDELPDIQLHRRKPPRDPS